MRVSFEPLSPKAIMPTRPHTSDAGWDIFVPEDTILTPGRVAFVSVHLRLHMPCVENLFAWNVATSGMSQRGFIILPGVIDPGYEGDIGPLVLNLSGSLVCLPAKTKVSQLLFMQTAYVELDTDFRTKGFRPAKRWFL